MTRTLFSETARARPTRKSTCGFTLIEIMVALALGMVILLALTTMFSRNTSNQSELERMTRQLEGARFSLDTLAEDIMHAGYFGEFNPDTADYPLGYTDPDPCATALTAQGWTTPNLPVIATPVLIPTPIRGIAASDTSATCLADRLAGTEAVIVRHADTGDAIAFAGGNTSNLFLQVSRCTSGPTAATPLVAAAVPSATPAATFKLLMPDCTTVNDRIRRLTQRTYYIASCNFCSPSDGIPTLKRVEMIDGALRTLSIAEGVENLQVEYGLDNVPVARGDGVPDSFNTIGSGVINVVTPVTPNVWQNVVAVRVHLLTRSTAVTPGFVDGRSYRLGPDVTVTPAADRFKRTLMTTTVRLVNVGMRRE